MPEQAPRLLLDENLSRRLLAELADIFPESRHAVAVGLQSDDDAEI